MISVPTGSLPFVNSISILAILTSVPTGSLPFVNSMSVLIVLTSVPTGSLPFVNSMSVLVILTSVPTGSLPFVNSMSVLIGNALHGFSCPLGVLITKCALDAQALSNVIMSGCSPWFSD